MCYFVLVFEHLERHIKSYVIIYDYIATFNEFMPLPLPGGFQKRETQKTRIFCTVLGNQNCENHVKWMKSIIIDSLTKASPKSFIPYSFRAATMRSEIRICCKRFQKPFPPQYTNASIKICIRKYYDYHSQGTHGKLYNNPVFKNELWIKCTCITSYNVC